MDKILINGAVYTMDKENPVAEAVAIDGNKIAAVGTTEEIKGFADDNTEVIDLQGKMLIPGLIEGHCHPGLIAQTMSILFIDDTLDLDGILATVKEYVDANPDMECYCGFNYNVPAVMAAGGARIEYLDKISSDKPIFLFASGFHGGWGNSKALEIAGITQDTPDPIPNLMFYGREEDGKLTGEAVEALAMMPIVESLNLIDDKMLGECYGILSASYAECGMTAMAGCGDLKMLGGDCKAIQKELIDSGVIKQRIVDCAMVAFPSEAEEGLEELRKWSKLYNTDKYRINVFKVMLDGDSSTQSASFLEPCPLEPEIAPTIFDLETLKKYYAIVAAEGYDIHAHAIGDAAVRLNLDAAEYVRSLGYKENRITNAHTIFVAPEDRGRFAENDVTHNLSGQWIYSEEGFDEYFGDLVNKSYRLRPILEAGTRLGMGSDRPADGNGWDPRLSIYMCMKRAMPGCDVIMQGPEDCLTLQECLEAYTINNAYQLHMEDRLGQIKTGFYADLACFEKDMFKLQPEEILTDAVAFTMIDGEIVYSA